MQASAAAAFLDGLRPAQTPNLAANVAVSWQWAGKGARLEVHRVGP